MKNENPHCPNCQGLKVWEISAMYQTRPVLVDGERKDKLVRVFRCWECGIEFNEDELSEL
jgi:transposase